MIVADARVGPDFEIRGTMELVSSTNGFFQGGVVFGHPSWESQDWMAFRIQRTPDEGQCAYFGQHFYGSPSGPFRLPVPDRNAFTVRVQDRKLSATVNGAAIVGQVPDKGLVTTPDLQVGFGGYVDENLVSLRFRDVELRRLGCIHDLALTRRPRTMETDTCALAVAVLLASTGCDAVSTVRAWARPDAAATAPAAARGLFAPTGAVDRAQRVAWGRRQMLAAYDRVGKRDPRWDALARTRSRSRCRPSLGDVRVAARAGRADRGGPGGGGGRLRRPAGPPTCSRARSRTATRQPPSPRSSSAARSKA